MNLLEFRDAQPNIPAVFEARARVHPGRLAVQRAQENHSYASLNEAANRLAHWLTAERGETLEPIALLFPHDAAVIRAILAVLKAGRFYVPLHPHHKAEILAAILEDSTAKLLITTRAMLDLAARILPPDCRVLCVEDLPQGLPESDLALTLEPDHPGAIFYTSGSTGKPKGVLRSHLNLASSYITVGRIGPDDRLSHLFSNGFGAAAAHLYGALLGGATLCPFDLKTGSIDTLAAWITTERITFMHPPVAVLRSLISAVPKSTHFEHVRQVTLGGAALYREDIAGFWDVFPADCVVLHEMALTETGVLAMNEIRSDTKLPAGRIPPGKVVAGKEVWIADEDGRRLDHGETGEIIVRSELLAQGYWGDPVRTAAAYHPDPQNPRLRTYRTGDLGRLDSSGLLEHFGRLDSRVKIRGQQVDLTEVEGALKALPDVRDAVVLAQEGPQRELRLAAFLVPASSAGADMAAVRAALLAELPDFKVPAVYGILDALPLTANGKIDQKRLPALKAGRPDWLPDAVPPAGATQKTLAELWCELLDVDLVGSRDDFFALGGHSLAAGRLIGAVRQRLDAEISLQQVYAHPMLADLAAVIDADDAVAESGLSLEKQLQYLEGF